LVTTAKLLVYSITMVLVRGEPFRLCGWISNTLAYRSRVPEPGLRGKTFCS